MNIYLNLKFKTENLPEIIKILSKNAGDISKRKYDDPIDLLVYLLKRQGFLENSGIGDNDLSIDDDYIEIYGTHEVNYVNQKEILRKMAPYLEDSSASALSQTYGDIFKWTIRNNEFNAIRIAMDDDN